MHERFSLQTTQCQNASLGSLICTVCPHFCTLTPGNIGKCRVRHHNGTSIVPMMYGECSTIALEPIEKRPLFHFDPGGQYLAVGFYGCSLSCDFCLNYKVSQTTEGKSKKILPNELVSLAKSKSSRGIAFTFNEPTIYFEYLLDVGNVDPDFPLVLKTNGFVTSDTLSDLCCVIDAFNVDIKGDDKEYYEVCRGSLSPVIECVNEIYSANKHVEISYLVTPRLIRDTDHHNSMIAWLKEMPDIPVHLLYFYPFHRMHQAYDISDFLPLVDRFKENLEYVYVSNLYNDKVLKYRNTYCSSCGSLMIQREKGVNVITLECCNTIIGDKNEFK